MAINYTLKQLEKLPLDEQIRIKKEIIKNNDLELIPLGFLPDVVTDEYYFVSYSHLDYKEVYSDVFDLERAGLSIWYDRQISVGANWKDTAYKYMVPFACKGVIFYISENAILSRAIQEEIEFAKKYNKQRLVICLSNGKGEKTWDLAARLLKEGKIDEEKYKFIIESFPEEVIQLPYLMSDEVKASRIKESFPLPNKLDGKPIIRQRFLEMSHNPWKNPVEHEYGEYGVDLRILGLNDYYARDITIDDYLALLTDEDFAKECKEKAGGDLEPSFESCRFIIIRAAAFANLKSLESVEIPLSTNAITTICENAFYLCSNLSEIHFVGNRNTSRGISVRDNAFALCRKLEHFDFSNISLGKGCFMSCINLKEADLSYLKDVAINESAFSGCNELSNVVFPKELKSIGESAFYATGIKELRLPENLEKIGLFAFSFCRYLESLVIPSNVKEVGLCTFANCTSLREVKFMMTSAIKLADDIFDKCTDLERIFFNISQKELLSISKINKTTGQFNWLGLGHNNDILLICTDKTIVVKKSKPRV